MLFPLLANAQLKIVIEAYPESTPHDATLFLVSEFNDWNPGDSRYQFDKQADNTFVIDLPVAPDSFGYKITRGNWSSVEGRPNGRHRPDRIYKRKTNGPEEMRIQVQSWEDIDGGLFNFYTFILLLSAFQGILLILAINGIHENNVQANRILSLLIFLISFALLGRVSIYDRDIFNWGPWLKLVPEMIFFVYGPVFYLYLRTLLKLDQPPVRERILYFLPAVIHVLSYIPSLLEEKQTLIDSVVAQQVDLSIRTWGVMAFFLQLLVLVQGLETAQSIRGKQ